MREYVIPTYNLGKHTLDNAFDIVFSPETLTSTHGDSLEVSDWIDDKRTSNFDVKVDRIPWPLKRIFTGDKMRVSVNQHRITDAMGVANGVTIKNNIKLHFLGARFFKIESWFSLNELPTGTGHTCNIELSGSVKCHAFLLPPLNMIAEKFMISQCKRETDIYTGIIKKQFSPRP